MLLYFRFESVKVRILFRNVVIRFELLFVFLLEYIVIVLFLLLNVLYMVILLMFDDRVFVLYLIVIGFFIELDM